MHPRGLNDARQIARCIRIALTDFGRIRDGLEPGGRIEERESDLLLTVFFGPDDTSDRWEIVIRQATKP